MNRTPTRFWDFPSLAFLILALLTASQRLYTTHWAWELGSAIILTLIGVVLGLALGYSKFNRAAAFWLTLGFSIPIILLVMGWILYGGISWLERVADLSNRLAAALGLFFMGKPVQDTLLFVVFMALVFWMVSLMAGFAMVRFGNFIGAVVPAGVVLVIVQLYDLSKKGSDNALAVYIFLGLLILGRLTYVQRQLFWKKSRITLLGESRTDLNITLAAVALASIILVWLAPTSVKSFTDAIAAWKKFTRPLQDVQENLGHAVAGLNEPPKPRTVEFFGDALALGNQAATGDTVYYSVLAPLSTNPERYYWRVRSYNIFLNDQWYAENVTSTAFAPDHAPISLGDQEGFTGEFTFTVQSAGLGLVTPARPVWISSPSELFFLQVPDGKMDPIQFRSNSPVLTGTQYTVEANISEPTVLQLRNSGETYPTWVTSHYLQLPDNLSPDFLALATRITARYKTQYDRAAAITDYLRANITYSTTIAAPPAGQDPLAWFLFDSKKGFCNYFASVEVILMRDAGIPSRMVVGYAQGEFDSPNHYVIRARDSHAWPEAYFPGIGWVEFEPTTNQDPLTRPLGGSSSSGQLATATPTGQNSTGQENLPPAGGSIISLISVQTANLILQLILICVILFTFLRIYPYRTFVDSLEVDQSVSRRTLPFFLKRFYDMRALTPPGWLSRWAYLAGLNPIERSFATVYTSLRWLGEKPPVAQTPAEAAAALARRLPDVSNEIDSLLHEYQNHFYSPIHGYLPLARRAVKVIRQEALRVAIRQRWSVLRGILRLG